jgi:AmmeMemoRadiSam system protein B
MLPSDVMERQFTRRAAVAGTWYPDDPASLAGEVDSYLNQVSGSPVGSITAIIAPHAGLMYSGPVAAHAYRAVAGNAYDVVVLIGPSHYAPFDGVAIVDRGIFASPAGDFPVESTLAAVLAATSPVMRVDPSPHLAEHSLEMQLPFLGRVLPGTPILPLLMGYQDRETIEELARALPQVLAGRRALLVASTDLSHYLDARTAARFDARVIDFVNRFDPEGMLREFELYPEHDRGRYFGCGGGPAISVIFAARELGARDSQVLRYADSGDVSGDKSAVVGYMAAALGQFGSTDVERQ